MEMTEVVRATDLRREDGRARVLAVDGGQSAVRVRHSDVGGTTEVEGVSRLEGDTIGAVVAAVVEGWRVGGSPPVERVVLGLTTAPSDPRSRERLCADVSAGTDASEVWLADDAVTAHAGALSLGWGVSVTVGTGVACLVLPEAGEPRIVGGHGYLLGDEGGAFWIGREGLRASLRAVDGRGPRTTLEGAVADRFEGLADLGDRLHSAIRPVDAIARFAPDVLRTAEAGDEVASGIIDGAVAELVTLVRAAVSVASSSKVPVPVALGGRLLADGQGLRARLDRALAMSPRGPDIACRGADGSPLDGAMALGRRPTPGRYESLVSVWRASP
jgi:N-acetylglucosamine kinase-like BadF-type ATPase